MAAGVAWLIVGGGLGVVLLVLCATRLVRGPRQSGLSGTVALSAIGAGLAAAIGLLSLLSTQYRWAGWQTGLAVSVAAACVGAALLALVAKHLIHAPFQSRLAGVLQEFTLSAVGCAGLSAIAVLARPGTFTVWIGYLAWLIMAGLAVRVLVWSVRRLLRQPYRSRLVGLVTMFAAVAAVWLVGRLLLRSVRAPSYLHDHEWALWHAGAAVVAVVALIAVAWQWPAMGLRVTAVTLVVLWLGVAFEVGRGSLYQASLRAEQTAVTQLDRQLYQAKPLKDKVARQKARSAQVAIADACTQTGGALHPEDPMTDRAEKTDQPSYNNRDTCGERAVTPLNRVDDARASAAAAVRPLLDKAKVDQRRATSLGAERSRLTELDKQLSEAKSINRDAAQRASAQQAQAAIACACAQAGGVLGPAASTIDGTAQSDQPRYDKSDTCQEATRPIYEVVAARTKAAETVAEVQAALGKTGADKQLADAEAARAAAESAKADKLTAQAGAPVESVAASGRELAANATGAHPDSAVSVGVVGWVLCLLAAVYFYRRLEILNAGLAPGPVTVEMEAHGDKNSTPATSEGKTAAPGGKTPTETTAETAAADIASVLRHHLLKNIPQPPVIPGGQAVQSITDLVGLDAVHGKVLNAVLAVVHTLSFPRRGYIVRSTITRSVAAAAADSGVTTSGASVPGGAGAMGRYEICVRVLSARTGETMHTCTARNHIVEDALAEAGYDAAVWIINEARAVSPWLRWEPDAAKAFLSFERLQGGDDQPSATQIDALKKVIREAPQCGAALVYLAEQLDLARNHVEAVKYYHRACQIFPEYPLARYRRARGVDMVATGFGNRPHADQALIRRVVNIDNAAATDLHRWALKEAGRSVWLAVLLPLRKLSVRERAGAWPFRQWLGIVAIMWSARGPTLVRCGKRFLTRRLVERIAKWRRMDCAVSYNLACYEATVSKADHHERYRHSDQAVDHRKKAIEHLQRCFHRPNVSVLSSQWLSIDPDLDPLREDEATKDGFNDIKQHMRR